MIVIEAVPITDAMLTSSTLVEDPAPEWSAVTTYAVGQRVKVSSAHLVYERLTAGSGGTGPASDTAAWAEVGPTNRWGLFDESTGTPSVGAGSMSWTFSPGRITDLVLIELSATLVRVTVRDGVGGPVVYDNTVSLKKSASKSWTEWWLEPAVYRSALVLRNLPPYSDASVTVTVSAPGTTPVSAGVCVVGRGYELGGTQYGVAGGIRDYSVKTEDKYGRMTVKEGAWARRLAIPVQVENTSLDEVIRRLTRLRARLAVYVGLVDYDCMVTYGYYQDWGFDMQYETLSRISINVQGLSTS